MNETAATAIIERMGQQCNILRASTTGTDSYRNPVKTWGPVGTEVAARLYPSFRDLPQQRDSLAGELDEDNPIFLFRSGADVEDGDRIVYDGTEYTVRTITDYPMYRRATTQKL